MRIGLSETTVMRDYHKGTSDHRTELPYSHGACGIGMQIGVSETTVMRDYHKDALDRYNVTCDFPTVIRELVDPHKRFPFQACSPLPITPAQEAMSLSSDCTYYPTPLAWTVSRRACLLPATGLHVDCSACHLLLKKVQHSAASGTKRPDADVRFI